MTRERALPSLALVAVLVGAAVAAEAQTALRSAIVGTVTDETGAVLAGAIVTASRPNLAGGTLSAARGGPGEYRLVGLLPGVYVLRVAAPGFRAMRREVQLGVETTLTVDFRLSIGALESSTDITAPTPVVDVTSAATPTPLARTMLDALPTTRDLADLLNLAPGVAQDVAYGGTQESNGLSVDGVSLLEPLVGDIAARVSYDWLEDVRITGLGANAEYGGSTGATVAAVYRSGTNRFSGAGDVYAIASGWTDDNMGSVPAKWRPQLPSYTQLAWHDANGQLGGPLARDRAWFFVGLQHGRHEYKPFGYAGPGATDERTLRPLVKLDVAPGAAFRLQGFYSHDHRHTDNAALGPAGYGPDPATAMVWRHDADTWNARATWSASASTLVDARVGGLVSAHAEDPSPPATREDPVSRYEATTGFYADAAPSFSETHPRSTTAALAVTHYADAALGAHELKAGTEFEHASYSDLFGLPGNALVTEENGVPVLLETWPGDTTRFATNRTTVYVQDRWRPWRRLTLEPGVRVDWNQGRVPAGGQVIGTTAVAPRIGAAWDVTSDHRTVVRAHYGRYFDMLFGQIYAGQDQTGITQHVVYAVVPPSGTIEVDRWSYAVPSAMARHVKPSRVDQWVAGIERELPGSIAAEARYIWRSFGGFIGYSDPLVDAASFFTITDPGPDGIRDNADDGGPLRVAKTPPWPGNWTITNPANAWRRYEAVQLVATRPERQGWQFQASYTWSRSNGTISNVPHSNATFALLSPAGVGADPNKHAQAAGRQFAFNEVKVLGSWQTARWGGWLAAAVGRWQTGNRWTRRVNTGRPYFATVAAEPIGWRNGPAIGSLDLRLEKRVRLPGTVTLGVLADVLNATNAGAPLRVIEASGPNLGRPIAWTEPRRLRVGARCTF